MSCPRPSHWSAEGYAMVKSAKQVGAYQCKDWTSLESKSSTPPMSGIVEKLRAIKKTDPELYVEAWNKLSPKTQAAILSYEAHEQSSDHPHADLDRHKPSHALSSSTSDHSPHQHSRAWEHSEDYHKPAQIHAGATDWEAPERSHSHHSPSKSHGHDAATHLLKPSASTAAEGSEELDTRRAKTRVKTGETDETEKELRKSVSAQIPKAHQIMKNAASERHLPTTLQEVLLATQVYELELIRIGLNRLTRQLEKQ